MAYTNPELQKAPFLFLSDHPNQYFDKFTNILKDGYDNLENKNVDGSFILKDTFLSARNLNIVQKMICREVLKRTGIEIPYQNMIHITEVANAIYDIYGQNLPYNLKEQIYELDMKMVLHLADIAVNELYVRARYYRDIESANFIENPQYMGSKGQRALPSTFRSL